MEYPEGYTYPGLPRLYNPALLDGFRERPNHRASPGRQYPEQNKPTRIQRIPSHAQDECHHRGGQLLHHPGGGLRTELVKYARVKEEDSGPSCSLAEALEKQDLFINSTLAQLGCNILWKMFRNGMIEHHGLFLNLGTMKVNPVLI